MPPRHWATASIGLLTVEIDVVADQLNGDFAAALVGNVGEPGAGGLFDRDRDDLVFLFRPGAAHLYRALRCGLHGVDILFRRLVRLLRVHPEHEFVERQHRDRRQILPVERNAGGKRSGEEVGERDDDLVRVAARSLEVEETFAAGATRLVDDDERLLHQIVLGDDALDRPRHLIGAAAGAGGNDELDRSHRLPGGGRGNRDPGRAQCRNRSERKMCRTHHLFHSRRIVTPVFCRLVSSYSIECRWSSGTPDRTPQWLAHREFCMLELYERPAGAASAPFGQLQGRAQKNAEGSGVLPILADVLFAVLEGLRIPIPSMRSFSKCERWSYSCI